MRERFDRYALAASDFVGSTSAFLLACAIVIAWGIAGPFTGFTHGWQLAINNGTNIVTFLIVFLIQHAQNRDTRAMRLKLDELLRTAQGARPSLIDLDRLSEDEITRLEDQFKRWRESVDRRDQPKRRAS